MQEDDKLRQLVARHGSKNWTRIASLLPSKVGKQCRRRWQNHLNATLKTHVWTADEDRTLLEGHRVLGNKWTEIARMVTGRCALPSPFSPPYARTEIPCSGRRPLMSAVRAIAARTTP